PDPRIGPRRNAPRARSAPGRAGAWSRRAADLPRSRRASRALGPDPGVVRGAGRGRGGGGGRRPTPPADECLAGNPPLPALRARLFAPARDPSWGAAAALVASLLISFVAMAATGRDAVAGFGHLLSGAFGGPGPLGETALKTSILILTGLSVAVALVVGL